MFNLHTKFFAFGFLYYLILPLVVGAYSFFIEYPGMRRWHVDFSLLNASAIYTYMFVILTFFFSFFLIEIIFKFFHLKVKCSHQKRTVVHRELFWLNLICIPLVLLSTLIVLLNFSLLFQGYSADHHAVSGAKGMLTTSTMVLLFITLVNHISDYRQPITKLVLTCVIFLSFILLFSGTRMYSLIVILGFLGNYISYCKVNWKLLISISGGIFILLLSVGLLRMGSDIKFDLLAYIFLAEPIFTWWSASTYLSGNEFNFLSVPISFFSSVINFIPSFLLPNKASYMVNLSDLAIFEAPLGASSVYVGVQANFGYFFGLLYFLVLGASYSLLNMLARYNVYIRAYYLCCCALLPFQFFRDGFFIFNKQLFWNFMIVPLFMLLTAKVIVYFTYKRT